MKKAIPPLPEKMILNFFRSFFQIKARQYRSAGFSHLAYYPEGTYGAARGKLLFEFGNLMRVMSRSFSNVSDS